MVHCLCYIYIYIGFRAPGGTGGDRGPGGIGGDRGPGAGELMEYNPLIEFDHEII